MSLLRHSRLRLALFWSLFALAAVATAAAVWVLRATVRAGLEEQERDVLARESARATSQAGNYVDGVRRSIIAELAGFHADGLGRALRRWDEVNAVVSGTFEWDAARGFGSADVLPVSGVTADELPGLWQAFATWRVGNPGAETCDLHDVGPWQVGHMRTRDNPFLPADSLRYQTENLDVLAYAGRPVDPWAGWAARADDPRAPWIVWYRPGPDAAVRGCLVDVAPLLAELALELGDNPLVSIALEPAQGGGDGRVGLPGFPALRLAVEPGAVLTVRQSRVNLSILAVALLAGVFVLGAGWLGIYSRREARDAERKTTFVSQVSHELRTPLTSIRMFADMLGAPGLPEEKRMKFSGTISRESQRLTGLVERLLAFNALERGRAAVVDAVDVAELVRETLEECGAALDGSGLRLEREIPAGACTVTTDRDAVKQALINLVDNAARYARDGGLVRVVLAREEGGVVLRVIDRDPGIPLAARRRIFEPFEQGGGALTDKAPGLGLGLSIARGLLRRAGGDLVLATVDRGATFEIRLPCVNAA